MTSRTLGSMDCFVDVLVDSWRAGLFSRAGSAAMEVVGEAGTGEGTRSHAVVSGRATEVM